MAHILIVDDEPSLRELLSAFLEQEGHRCDTARDGREGCEKVRATEYDLILTDVRMPNMSGIQFLEEIEGLVEGKTPCMILTALAHDPAVAVRAVRLACDFLAKPFEMSRVRQAVGRALDLRTAWKARENHERWLQARLREREAELERTYDGVLIGFAAMLEGKDVHQEDEKAEAWGTSRHCQRLRETCTVLGNAMDLPPAELRRLQRGAMLHDVGKYRIPDRILWKRGPLTAEEWIEMKRHPEYGAEFVRRVPFLAEAVDVILCHHERWDGGGYPRGLEGEAIPRVARIFSVADAFDAMTNPRCYQPQARSPWEALDEIRRGAGRQFDPLVVEVFERVFPAVCRAVRLPLAGPEGVPAGPNGRVAGPTVTLAPRAAS